MISEVKNMDCMDYMRQFPDKFFDLAVVDPPYGIDKAFTKTRTDTSYFHDYIYHKAEIRFIRGRLKFGESKTSAPFPSMVVIYNNQNN